MVNVRVNENYFFNIICSLKDYNNVKIYFLLFNNPDGYTPRELSYILNISLFNVYKKISFLLNNGFIEKVYFNNIAYKIRLLIK